MADVSTAPPGAGIEVPYPDTSLLVTDDAAEKIRLLESKLAKLEPKPGG